MNPYLKYAFTVFAVVVTLLIGLVLYIAATFDPNAYKPQIIQLVNEKKQRELKLDGDIKLTFFPSLRANVENIALNEYNSDKEFATAENVLVSIALMPLFKKQLVVNEITVKGLKANLIRFKDGRINIDDLIAKGETSEQFKFDIERVQVEKTTLTFHDEASDEQYIFRDVNFRADRADPRSRSINDVILSNVKLAFRVDHPHQAETNLVTSLEFGLMLDFDKQHYAVDDFRLESKGKVTGIDNLVINSRGNLFIKPAAHEFVANKLTLGITGLSGTNKLDIEFVAPRLSLTARKVTSDKITLVAKMTNSESSTSGNLFLSDMEGTISDFKSRALTVELESKKGDLAVKAMLASPLIGNLDTRQLNLPDLAGFINVNNPGIPDNSINGTLLGSASVDGVSQNIQATLAGMFTDSNIKAKLAATGFVQPVFNFDVDIDQLDLDRFLPQQQGQGKHTEKAKSAKSLGESLNLSVLKDLKVHGSIRIGLLKTINVKSSKVKLDIST